MNIQSGNLKIETSVFGSLADGRKVELFSLSNGKGMTVKVTNYGAIISELHAPARDGKSGNVVLGFDNVERYLKGHPFFGCVAGRYANRIAKGKFKLEGTEYTLAINNGANHLHGGLVGFDKKLWNILSVSVEDNSAKVRFSYASADGEEGYPGDLLVIVTYSLNERNEFRIDYEAATKKTTVLNLTNHSYFNLAGHGNILQHELQIESDHFTEVDSGLIPTGKILPVAGTALDFTKPHTIGERAAGGGLGDPGYDHNFILRDFDGRLHLAATAYDPSTGRVMECLTSQPAVQLWTFNREPAPDLVCTGNWQVPKHGGFCLETQHYPDSPNHPGFPTTVLHPKEKFESSTVYRFSVR